MFAICDEHSMMAGERVGGKNIEQLLALADVEIDCLKHEVRSYLNANALIWGWKQPETVWDHDDLVIAVMAQSPHFRFDKDHDPAHLLQILRSERVVEPPVVVFDDTPSVKSRSSSRSSKNRKRSSSSSSSSSDTPWVAPVFDSYDGGSGSYSD